MKYRKYIFLTATFFLASVAAQAQPEANEIVFTGNTGGGLQIYSMRADGSNLVNLTSTENGYSPAWSPDGTKIVYARGSIWVMNADGSNKTEFLAQGWDWADGPVWSPDGSKIAFFALFFIGCDFPPLCYESRIYVMNADGTNLTLLPMMSGYDWGPDWSPDGSKIAFSSYSQICVMNADGTNQINITNSGFNENPEWSPDGTKIAFSSNRDGNYEIYVMNSDGSNQVRITNSPANDSSPSWSPDGTRLAFTSNREGISHIYVMNADGTNTTRLTQNLLGNYGPHWKRAAPAAQHQISGRVTTSAGRGIPQVRVMLDDDNGNVRLALTSSFGYFRFDDVPTGKYTVSVQGKGYSFAPQTIGVSTSITDLDFTALENP